MDLSPFTRLTDPHSPSVLTTLNALYLAVILLEVRFPRPALHSLPTFRLTTRDVSPGHRQESLGAGAGGRMNLLAVFVKTTYDSFTTILVTRFLVHLQEAARPAMGSAISSGSDVWTELGGGAGEADTTTLQWTRVGEDVDC